VNAGIEALVAAAALVSAPVFAAVVIRRTPPGSENWRGRPVPRTLGLAFGASIALGSALATWVDLPPRSGGRTVWLAGFLFLLVVLLVGFLDDTRGGAERGFRDHLRSLARLRPSTGVAKLVAGIGSAVVLAVLLGGGWPRVVAAAVLIAVSTNLANVLDVRPGRALKWFLPLVAASWAALSGDALALLMAAALGAGLGVLPFDLAESGMLGDAGSNPLGMVAGLGLAAALSTPWLYVAAALTLALQVTAETVTISRLIEAVPPLRWFDRLGRAS